jgi:hypothetical protein
MTPERALPQRPAPRDRLRDARVEAAGGIRGRDGEAIAALGRLCGGEHAVGARRGAHQLDSPGVRAGPSLALDAAGEPPLLGVVVEGDRARRTGSRDVRQRSGSGSDRAGRGDRRRQRRDGRRRSDSGRSPASSRSIKRAESFGELRAYALERWRRKAASRASHSPPTVAIQVIASDIGAGVIR